MNEGKKDRRDPIRTVKPRNFVAKNMGTTTSGAGAHKDKKKAMKQGDTKHKNKDYAESLQSMLESALRDKEDYNEKRKALDDLSRNKDVDQKAVQQRRLDLDKEANAKGMSEEFDSPEYNDEAGMATSNLLTLARAVKGLHDTIGDNDNLPEWCQEKIAKSEQMLVSVWDYLLSQKEQGIDPKVDEAGYNNRDAYQRDYDSSRTGFGRRDREDDEYHVPDPDPEFQRNRQETMQYNVTVNGKPMTEKPFLGRSAALAWAKQQVNAGNLDPKEAKLSPVQYSEGAKVDRQAKHITASMMKKGKSKKDAEAIAWAHIKHPKKKKAEEGWTHDSLADQLFEHERTYEEQLQSQLNKKLGK